MCRLCLTEGQLLKKTREAESRRIKLEKQKTETMENTKARIRAGTSAKLKEMLGTIPNNNKNSNS